MSEYSADEVRERLEAVRTRHAGDPYARDAQQELQDLHLRWADQLGQRAEAEVHLRAAEDAQWALGSAATGSGEGLASMQRLYEIRARRARLAEALGERTAALDLWESIAADPNGLGAFAVAEAERLKRG